MPRKPSPETELRRVKRELRVEYAASSRHAQACDALKREVARLRADLDRANRRIDALLKLESDRD